MYKNHYEMFVSIMDRNRKGFSAAGLKLVENKTFHELNMSQVNKHTLHKYTFENAVFFIHIP